MVTRNPKRAGRGGRSRTWLAIVTACVNLSCSVPVAVTVGTLLHNWQYGFVTFLATGLCVRRYLHGVADNRTRIRRAAWAGGLACILVGASSMDTLIVSLPLLAGNIWALNLVSPAVCESDIEGYAPPPILPRDDFWGDWLHMFRYNKMDGK